MSQCPPGYVAWRNRYAQGCNLAETDRRTVESHSPVRYRSLSPMRREPFTEFHGPPIDVPEYQPPPAYGYRYYEREYGRPVSPLRGGLVCPPGEVAWANQYGSGCHPAELDRRTVESRFRSPRRELERPPMRYGSPRLLRDYDSLRGGGMKGYGCREK